MKVALVHDYLREYGGAERVLEALHEIFPEAPVYTFYYNSRGLGIHSDRFKGWDIRVSWWQKVPFANKLLSASRVIAPMVFEGFDLADYDLVISSCNHHSAKAVITSPKTLHISYIHTPPKMLYGYTTSFNYKKHWWTRISGEIANHFLRIYDFEISQRPDMLIANSEEVKKRINKFYRRDAVVIYPPIDLEPFKKTKKVKGNYFVALNRLTRGKGTEIVIAACSKLGLPLKVIGDGPELDNLKKIASKDVQFLGHVTDDEKAKLLSSATALITCTEQEDFGMTPVEAMAAGTPVIAAASGGYLETVTSATGELFEVSANLGESTEYADLPSVENLMVVLKKFDPAKYSPAVLKKQANQFSKERFKKEILELIKKICPHGI